VSIISTATQEDKAGAAMLVRIAARMMDSIAMRCMKVTTRIRIGGFELKWRDACLGAARSGGVMSQALTHILPGPLA
jgi:hypothetical protein